jgi:hypothetical protein
MKPIIVTTILFISFILSGCELFQDNEYYHLPDSRRSLLNTGDYLVYEDCNSRLDTIRVLKKLRGTYKQPLSGSNCGEPGAYYDLELLYFVDQKERGSDKFCPNLGATTNFGSCEGFYGCYKSILFLLQAKDSRRKSNSSSNQPRLSWYGKYEIYPKSFIESMTVLNNDYRNVYYYEGSFIHEYYYFDEDFIHHIDSIRGIYYSCQYGIIQMDMMDGNELKLVR